MLIIPTVIMAIESDSDRAYMTLTLPVKTVIIWLVFGYASAQRSFASVYHIQKRAKRTRTKR